MLLNNTLQDFHAPRQTGDIDYIQEITKILQEVGYSQAATWADDTCIQQVTTCNPLVQAAACNDYWRVVLASLTDDTTAARYCLGNPYQEPALYLHLFKTCVAPALMQNQATVQ